MVNAVKKTDISVEIGKMQLKNPIITASGTFGYANEFEEYVNLQEIGAVITKGITLKPLAGNPQPRIREVKGGMINSIGLENVGIHSFIENKLPVLKEKDIEFIVNIAGFSLNEYKGLAKICEDNRIKAIELNVSCPNVEKGCLEFGRDPETLYELVSTVREIYSGTLIIKLSSNVSSPVELVHTVEKAQADAISAINTVRAMQVNAGISDGKIQYSFIKGGLSGSVIKPMALNFIYEVRKESNIPIIGMGGISSVNDILEFIAVGANAVQIGTANFTHPTIAGKLVNGLEELLIKNGVQSVQDLYEGV